MLTTRWWLRVTVTFFKEKNKKNWHGVCAVKLPLCLLNFIIHNVFIMLQMVTAIESSHTVSTDKIFVEM